MLVLYIHSKRCSSSVLRSKYPGCKAHVYVCFLNAVLSTYVRAVESFSSPNVAPGFARSFSEADCNTRLLHSDLEHWNPSNISVTGIAEDATQAGTLQQQSSLPRRAKSQHTFSSSPDIRASTLRKSFFSAFKFSR